MSPDNHLGPSPGFTPCKSPCWTVFMLWVPPNARAVLQGHNACGWNSLSVGLRSSGVRVLQVTDRIRKLIADQEVDVHNLQMCVTGELATKRCC